MLSHTCAALDPFRSVSNPHILSASMDKAFVRRYQPDDYDAILEIVSPWPRAMRLLPVYSSPPTIIIPVPRNDRRQHQVRTGMDHILIRLVHSLPETQSGYMLRPRRWVRESSRLHRWHIVHAGLRAQAPDRLPPNSGPRLDARSRQDR